MEVVESFNPMRRGPRVLPKELFKVEIGRVFSFAQKVRDYYQKLEKNTSLFHYSFFSPVVSILGERGSGKTSFLYTLLNTWKEKYPYDIVLPPIDPHKFKKGDRLLEMILVSLEREVEELKEFPVPKELRKKCPFSSEFETSCLWMCYQKAIEGAHAAYRSDEQITGDQVIYSSSFRLKVEFPRRFGELVRCLTEVKKKSLFSYDRSLYLENFQTEESEGNSYIYSYKLPLLVVPIDDIDLVPEYLEDVSYVIRLLAGNIHRLLLIVTANLRVSEQSMASYYASLLLGKVSENAIFRKFFEEDKLPFFKQNEFLSEIANLVHQFHLKFFPLDGRVVLKPPKEEDILKYVPPISEHRKREEDERIGKLPKFSELLRQRRLPGSKKASFYDLIVYSPFGLFKKLLPENWREVEEIYYALLEEEKNEGIPEAFKALIRKKIKASETLSGAIREYLDIDFGDKIYLELKQNAKKKLLDDLRIKVVYAPSPFTNERKEEEEIYVAKKLSILSPDFTIADLAILLLLTELFVSSYETEVLISFNLLRFIYSILPPPVVLRREGNAYFYTFMTKRMLERFRIRESQSKESERGIENLFYPFSFFYLALKKGLRGKKLEQEFSQLVTSVLGFSKLEENLYTPEVLILEESEEEELTTREKRTPEEQGTLIGGRLEFKLAKFGSWEDFKKALLNFELPQQVYRIVTEEEGKLQETQENKHRVCLVHHKTNHDLDSRRKKNAEEELQRESKPKKKSRKETEDS